MPKSPLPKPYQKFLNRLKGCFAIVSCPSCPDETMPIKSYEKHCKDRHGWDRCCAFCSGRETWPRGQKMQNGLHLLECFSRFVARRGVPNELPATTGPRPHCSERCFEFRSESCKRLATAVWSDYEWNDCKIRWIEEPLFESNAKRLDFGEADEVWRKYDGAPDADKQKWLALLNPLRFDSSGGLDEACDWMRRYLYTSWETNNARHYTWYHLCVRACYTKSFVEAVKGLDVVAAPHWCVCDGGVGFGNPELQARKHHRHLILAVKNHTKYHNALKNLKYEGSGEAPKSIVKKYYSKQIKSANHFAASLVYVSRPRSQCKCKEFVDDDEPIDDDFYFLDLAIRGSRKTLSSHERHYVIAKTMMPHALYHLMLLVPGGGMDVLARYGTGSKSLFDMKSRHSEGNEWMLSASEELDVKNCVVRFEPCNLQIDAAHPIQDLSEYLRFEIRPFVYWFRGRVFPATPGEYPPTDNFQEWHVSRRTNTLLNLGNADDRFLLSRRMVRHANDLVKMEKACMEKKNVEHLAEMNRLRLDLDEMQIKINRLHDGPHETLAKQLETCRAELYKCKNELYACKNEQIRHLNDEIKQLKKDLKAEKRKHQTTKNNFEKYRDEHSCKRQRRM